MTTAAGARLTVPTTTSRVGVARRDITPPHGIRANSWPLSDWERSEGAHRPMTLTALAVESSDGEPFVLFAVDGTFWGRVDDEWHVRGRILENLGLRADQLMFSLSHTHSGPLLSSTFKDKAGGEHILPYHDQLVDAATSAAREALDGLQPGRIEWTTGRSSLAGERELDLEGRPVVGFNPEVAPDDTVVIGRITDEAGTVLGTLVNYACHPTTLAWQNRLISPDWVGGMREIVEAVTGAPCMFVQGASGELAPKEQYTGDVAIADAHGRSIGHAVVAALEGMQPPGTDLTLVGVAESGAPLAMWESTRHDPSASSQRVLGGRFEVTLEVVDLPSLDELRERWKDIDPRSREERLSRARDLRDNFIDGPTVDHPYWVWIWGDAIVVAQPGEAYSRLQQTLRSRFPDHAVVVGNLTNGPGFAYLPTKDAYDRKAYQAWQTVFAVGSLERLENAATDTITTLLASR